MEILRLACYACFESEFAAVKNQERGLRSGGICYCRLLSRIRMSDTYMSTGMAGHPVDHFQKYCGVTCLSAHQLFEGLNAIDRPMTVCDIFEKAFGLKMHIFMTCKLICGLRGFATSKEKFMRHFKVDLHSLLQQRAIEHFEQFYTRNERGDCQKL